ncbi:MAG: hypothetical protein AMXMBFR80_02970 [Dehalococcoidia bacterium]|nr:hypothetical protein [Tepidiformaceae bacterium]
MENEPARWDGWLGPKQWMPIVGVLSVAVIALVALLILNSGDEADAGGGEAALGVSGGTRPLTHEHADFAVVIRGEKFDFSDPRFISDTEGKELSENVHLHAPRFSVVHVHRTLTTWDEFFRSLGFTLTDPSFPGTTSERTCMELPSREKLCNSATESWKFIANGVVVDGLANVYIGDLDRVLFSYGPEAADEVIASQWPDVTDQACIPAELCVERIPADEPRETCSGRQDSCGP